MTPDEILRDRLVLGIRDDRVRERLLRLNDLSLQQAVDIIKSSEQTQQQVKQMTGGDMRHRRPDLQENLKKNDNSSHKHLKDRLENVEIAEWCTDVIVPRMEEHVLAVGHESFCS